jgi:predicted RNA-binding Zn ribbon-like protein
MRKQQQAPGELEHVRAFVNTLDKDPDTEELTSPAALATWLGERGLLAPDATATDADLAHAIELRQALRAVLIAHNESAPAPPYACSVLDETVCRAGLRLRFDDRGDAVLEPQAGGVDGGLGRLLAIVHGAIAQGTWQRLKACRLHSCEWVFYDHTKNRSGAWCNMDVCGNRAKARAYRERRAVSAA